MKKFWRFIIEELNKVFGCEIEVNEENVKKVKSIIENFVGDNIDEFVDGSDYGYCPDCDERRGEPMINEGYL